MYKFLCRSVCGHLTFTPRSGKLDFLESGISLYQMGKEELIEFTSIYDIKLEKVFNRPFCITVRYADKENKVLCFSCYGHTTEIYEHIKHRINFKK